MLNMNVNSPRVNQVKSNQVNPNFKGVYAKIDKQWYNVAQEGVEVTTNVVKEAYQNGSSKHALTVISSKFGSLPVVLTDSDAERYSQSPKTREALAALFTDLLRSAVKLTHARSQNLNIIS